MAECCYQKNKWGRHMIWLNRLPFNEHPIKIPSSRQYSILREIREPVILGPFVNFDSS